MLDTRTLAEEQQQAFIEVEGDDPRAWGAQWWNQCKDEINKELEELSEQ